MRNYVLTAISALVNMVIPWAIIFHIKNTYEMGSWLLVTAIYTISVLSVYFDVGVSRNFFLKARSSNINIIFRFSIIRALLVSFVLSHLAFYVFSNLYDFKDYSISTHSTVVFVVCSGVLIHIISVYHELMGQYEKSISLKAFGWIILFMPIIFFGDIVFGLLVGAAIRFLLVMGLAIRIVVNNEKKNDGSMSDWVKADEKYIYLFGVAILISMAAERIWPGFINGEDQKAIMLFIIDITSKATFVSGIIGQAKINSYFNTGGGKKMPEFYVHFISILSAVVMFVFLVLSNTYLPKIKIDIAVSLLLAIYTYIQSVNQIIVVLSQREMNIEKIFFYSAVSLLVLMAFILIGYYYKSGYVIMVGLIGKALFECVAYTKVAREKNHF